MVFGSFVSEYLMEVKDFYDFMGFRILVWEFIFLFLVLI